VLRNKVAVLSNIAAVHMSKGEYGNTVRLCTEALEIDSDNTRVLLRRAKANILRHEYEVSLSLIYFSKAGMEMHAVHPRRRQHGMLDEKKVRGKFIGDQGIH
jgi:Tfp pilus assembly protein PilF